MTARRHLHTVSAPQPDEPRRDITAMLRADIMARDWSGVHIRSGRAQPLFLGEAPKRLWRL